MNNNNLRLYSFITAAIAGFLVFGACAFSFYNSLFWIIPLIPASIMALIWRGRKESLLVTPALNLLFSFFFFRPADFRRFVFADVLNFQRISQALTAHFKAPVLVYLWVLLISIAAALILHKIYKLDSRRRDPYRNTVIYSLLVLILVNMVLQMVLFNPDFFKAMNTDSESRLLMNDNSKYKRIYFMVCNGYRYYVAFFTTLHFYSGQDAHRFYFGYRLPGLWMLLKYITFGNGMLVQLYYILFALASAIASFLIMRRFLPMEESLTASVLLAPFLYYGIPGWHMLHDEYWCIFFMIIALAFSVYKKDPWAVLFLSLGAMIRVHFIAVTFLFPLAALFSKEKKNIAFLTIPFMVSIVVIISHLFVLHTFYRHLFADGLLLGFQGEGWFFVRKVLDFGAPFYSHWEILQTSFIILAIVSLFFIERRWRVFLGGYLIIFMAFFIFKGEGYRQYYGILSTPIFMLTAAFYPLAVSYFLKANPDCREQSFLSIKTN